MRSLRRWNEAIYLSAETKGAPPPHLHHYHQHPTHHLSLIHNLLSVSSDAALVGRRGSGMATAEEPQRVCSKTQKLLTVATTAKKAELGAAVSTNSARSLNFQKHDENNNQRQQSNQMPNGPKFWSFKGKAKLSHFPVALINGGLALLWWPALLAQGMNWSSWLLQPANIKVPNTYRRLILVW